MGRLIDADKVRSEYIHSITLEMDAADLLNMLCDIIDNAPTVETISKADYENRLKADMTAMITEIQLEIEELDYIIFDGITKRKCLKILDKYKTESKGDIASE